jgi:hypothetical protein
MKASRSKHTLSQFRGATAMPSSTSGQECTMDNVIVEELTSRLPTSDLVKIIKSALDCGKQNRPFTESDLLRAMTFGASPSKALRPGSAESAQPVRRR